VKVLLLLLIATILPVRALASEFVFLDSFGTSGPVHLDNPSSVAVAQDGTLWVADYGLGRVLHFTQTGTYLGELTPRPPQWMPTGVAVLANGQVAVAGGEVWLFNADGSGGTALGVSGGCYGIVARPQQGFFVSRQSAHDVLAWPEMLPFGRAPNAIGIALRPLTGDRLEQSELYSTSVYDSKVSSHEWGGGVIQFSATALGFFSAPLDVECFGNAVLVADTGNHHVLVMTADLHYLSYFGSLGSGPGQMSRPSGLAFTPDGVLFVTDLDLNRVSRFIQAPTTPTQPASWGRIKSLFR